MRFYLGVGKYTPNAAVVGEIGWQPIIIEQWKSTCNLGSRCFTQSEDRLNKRIFSWALSKRNDRCKNWPHFVKEKLKSLNMERFIQSIPSSKDFKQNITRALMNGHTSKWTQELNQTNGIRGSTNLRVYRL